MRIKEINARVILDSRNEKTAEVSVKTNYGLFVASSPSGKSKGKNEAASYKKSSEEDCRELMNLSNKISEIEIEKFFDLEKVENIASGLIGANVLYALETAILKALALEQGKELWQVINPRAKRFPSPIGNCIEGGMHSSLNVKPDFQEFLVIPRNKKFAENVFLMNKARDICGKILELRKSKGKFGDENGFSTGLKNEETLDVLNKAREELEKSGEKVDIGLDIASSSFYNKNLRKYEYKNPFKRINNEEQTNYIESLIENFRLFYAEDPLHEEDFSGFSKFRSEIIKKRACLVVGDDLICSQLERLKKALENRAVNAIIVKPNQTGSLVETAKLVALAKRFEIITIFSHRSGETMDYALADLAFAFQTEFIKTGITGKEREIKLKRMIEIEKGFG